MGEANLRPQMAHYTTILRFSLTLSLTWICFPKKSLDLSCHSLNSRMRMRSLKWQMIAVSALRGISTPMMWDNAGEWARNWKLVWLALTKVSSVLLKQPLVASKNLASDVKALIMALTSTPTGSIFALVECNNGTCWTMKTKMQWKYSVYFGL